MTHTEKVALAMAWYDSGLEDRAAFQTLMESLFAQPEQEPCVHAKNPKGCYRIRCQLGDKCVDDEMSFRTAPPQRTWVGAGDLENSNAYLTPPQPEQEPMISKWVLREVYFDEDGEPISHRSPPQRKPLTDEEIEKLADDFLAYQIEDYQVSGVFTFARAIEAAHGIKGEA